MVVPSLHCSCTVSTTYTTLGHSAFLFERLRFALMCWPIATHQRRRFAAGYCRNAYALLHPLMFVGMA